MSIWQKLRESPIDYFSDLFLVATVAIWAGVAVLMAAVAVYATVALADTTMWDAVGTMAAAPVTAGLGVYILQLAVGKYKGTARVKDFPADTDSDTDSDTEGGCG